MKTLKLQELNEAVSAYLSGIASGYKMTSLVDLVERSSKTFQKKFWQLVDEG